MVRTGGRACVLGVLVALAPLARGAEAPSLEEELRIRLRAGERVKRAHEALLAYDSGAAVAHLRAALVMMQRLESGESREVEVAGAMAGGGGGAPEGDPALSNVMFLLEASAAPWDIESQGRVEAFGPDYQRELAVSEKARELAEKARELGAEQRDISRQIAEAARQGAEPATAGEQAAGTAPPPAGQAPSGAAPAGRVAELAERETAVASTAAQVADGFRELGADLTGSAQIADRFLAASAAASGAAGGLRRGNVEEAAALAELAARRLEEAVGELRRLPREEAERLVDALQGALERIAAEQEELRGRTERLARGAGGQAQSRSTPGGPAEEQVPRTSPDDLAEGQAQPGSGPNDLAELRMLGQAQDRLRRQMESVEGSLGELRRWAELEAGHETRSALAGANDIARRERVSQRMTNAVVAMGSSDLAAAAQEEERAARGAERILERVQDAARSMASDPLTELAAATVEASRVERGLAELAAETRAHQGDSGEGALSAADGRGRESRRQLAEQVAAEAGRLVRRVRARGFPADETDLAELARIGSARSSEFGLAVERGDSRLEPLLGASRRVKDRLEAEYKAQLDAKRLFEAQREECPPQYRRIVNRYFEVLAGAVQ